MSSIHLTTITAIIQVLKPSPSHLRITTNQAPSSKDLQEFFSILSNQRIHESMQSLRILSHSSRLPDIPIDIVTIEPLLRFSGLRELHLLTGNSLHVSDEELAAMGASWPCLEVINFNNDEDLGEVPSSNIIVTLRGLILLVNKTRLRSAHLAIKGDGLGLIEKCPASMVSTNDLQHLVLSDTTVDNPRDFALIVSLAFPKVKEIVGSALRRQNFYGECQGWDKVNEYLNVFRLFREGHWRT